MLKLSEESRGHLMGLQRGMGYQELLDIGEKLCQLSETDLLKMNRATGATPDQILSAQEQCRAQRVFFERLQIEIEEQVQALIADQVARTEPEEQNAGIHAVAEAADILGVISSGE